MQRQPGPWAGHDETIASKVWGRSKSGAPREARPPPRGAGSLRQVLLVSKQTVEIHLFKTSLSQYVSRLHRRTNGQLQASLVERRGCRGRPLPASAPAGYTRVSRFQMVASWLSPQGSPHMGERTTDWPPVARRGRVACWANIKVVRGRREGRVSKFSTHS